MKDINNYTCQTGRVHLMQLQGTWRHVMVVLAVFLCSSTVFAQNLPAPERCTSNDLRVVGASLTQGRCITCNEGDLLRSNLVLTIQNTTSSLRTAYAFWGTLEIVSPDGTTKSRTISGCNDSGFPGNSTRDLVSGVIEYECGDIVRILDFYGAWTDASDGARNMCPLDPSKIAPKCDVVPVLPITTPLFASATTTNVLCHGDRTGAIDVTASGGTAPYTYDWADLAGTSDPADRTGLAAGTYSLIVTDANRCSITKTYTITQPNAALSLSAALTNVLCHGGRTGAINLAVSGGTAPYTFDWADLVGTNDSEDRTGLAAGTYTVTVTDANHCTTTRNFTITEPNQLVITATGTNPTCENLSGGSVSGSITGGTAPYTVSINNFTSVITSSGAYTFPNLAAGTYTVMVRDVNYSATNGAGCTVSSTPVVLVTPVCVAFEGCTLGYWKNHPGSWTCPEYEPNTLYRDVFIVPINSPLYNLTLMQALNLTGGGIYNLGRQSVAALLNACHSSVNYELSVDAVILGVNNAISTGTAGTYASYLDRLNNAGCSIDAHGRPILTASSSSSLKGVETLEGNQITAYPTPFAERATIEFRFVKDENYTINLYDMKGSVVRQLKAGTARAGEVNQVEVDGRTLPEGLYIARMMSDSGVKTVKLLLKKQ